MNGVLGWLLNGNGASGAYSIYRLDATGRAANPTQIIGPGGGFTSVYWPCGVQVGGATFIYAIAQDAAGDQALGLWTSAGGGASFQGIVLAPVAGEGKIGSATVIYDPDDTAAPFKMWFGTNYGPRSTVIKYATSPDGIVWTRLGIVLTIGESYETEGFQLDYVCRDDGVWRLFYAATDDAPNVFRGVEATAACPEGPFVKRGVVLEPAPGGASVTSTLQPGTRYMRVGSTAALVEGHVYVLSNDLVASTQRVVIEKILNAAEVIVSDPIHVGGAGFALRAVDRLKVCVSALYTDQSGRRRALATGWGATTTVGCEYVYDLEETATGFSRRPDRAIGFKPVGPGSQNSFENPSPITSDPGRPVWASAPG